ncbi:metallophosphoesterase [Spirochaetota bacterium]
MKIIYLTDIHGAFTKIASLLFETVADIYIISGDLIDIPFYSLNSAIYYHELQTYFYSLRRKMEQDDIVMEDFVERLMEDPATSEAMQEKGSKYQQYSIRARRVMQQKYKVLENILASKSSASIFSIPGNYDMDLRFTSLHERDLHMHWHNINGVKIAGYGGADIWTSGIPERYIVKYKGGIGIDDKNNEMYSFLKAVKPHVIVTHQPAHGIHDRITYKGPSGSPSLRTFCENNDVKLCLSGHIHNDWGFQHVEGTVYLNPSNFGEVTTVKGEVSEGGFFYEIEVETDTPKRVILKKMINERIYDIAEYIYRENKWVEDIIDKERFTARKLNNNYDMKLTKYSHIPEIELFKEIKQFFRSFQTLETDERVDKLSNAIQLMNDESHDIAADIAGSVNVGLSQKSSDIDMVIYVRCKMKCPDLYEQCDHFKKTRKLIQDTQRFVTYRSICRPVNYKVIAPIEDMLNENIEFRKEMEGSIRSYFRIFKTTTEHIRSFDKYETRLKYIGIKIPEYIRRKIKEYLED